ncbi:glycosyl transferase [bacterium F11]|nr:glycosyl transferase [bacterium F11]
MKLSVVTTLYQSAPYIDEFYHRMRAVAEKITQDYEIIFVVDGESDHTLNQIVEVQRKDPGLVVVDLSRNFGHHHAIMTGLSYATGERIFLIDSDLEEEPEWLIPFAAAYDQGKVDVIFGVQKRRKGGLLERISGALFYWVFNMLASPKIRPNAVTARLMSRRYVHHLLQFKERALFLFGLWELAGFQQKTLPVDKKSKGTSTYSLSKRVDLFVNALTSFSVKPLVFIFYFGTLLSFVSFLYIVFLAYKKLVIGVPIEGWTSLIVSVWFLGGLIILSIGCLGIYISKIFIEVKLRPRSIIRDVYKSD